METFSTRDFYCSMKNILISCHCCKTPDMRVSSRFEQLLLKKQFTSVGLKNSVQLSKVDAGFYVSLTLPKINS